MRGSKKILLSSFVAILIFGSFFLGYQFAVIKNSTDIIASASEKADLNSFWKVWGLIDEMFVDSKKQTSDFEQERVWGAIKGMVDSLDDPYTEFMTPKEKQLFSETISGDFGGVGMEIGVKNGKLVVISALKDTPAEKAGIKSGDVISQIDGKTLDEQSVQDAVTLIRGPKGTTVILTILRAGEKTPLTFSIVRETIKIPTTKTENRKDGIFIIDLYNFTGNADAEFKKALREFFKTQNKKLIIDLRGNPGGYLDTAVDIASYFLPQGKVIVSEKYSSGKEEVIRSKGFSGINPETKIVVLVDEGSASASEILAGALKEQGRATVVGVKTFGKGSVQQVVNVTDDTLLKITVAKWFTPNGNSISDGGLEPNIFVEQDDSKEGDEQLNKAIEILNK